MSLKKSFSWIILQLLKYDAVTDDREMLYMHERHIQVKLQAQHSVALKHVLKQQQQQQQRI